MAKRKEPNSAWTLDELARLRAENKELRVAIKKARDFLAQSSKLDWDNEIIPILDTALKHDKKEG